MKRLIAFFKFVIKQLKRSVERFPITAMFAFGFVVIAIYQNHRSEGSFDSDVMERLLLVMVLGVFLSGALKILVERLKLQSSAKYGLAAAGVIPSGLYYLVMPAPLTDYFLLRYFALIGILFGLFLIFPYTPRREGLSRYVLHLFGKFFVTLFYSGVIFFGFWMILFSVENLFGIDWPSGIYFDVFITISGLFSVMYFLGNVPEVEAEMQIESYSKIFRTLFLYIILPIISIYTVILYAYFLKLLVERALPEGLIGNLVLWYALVSTATIYFVRDLKGEVPWLKRFLQVYIPVMVIPMGMLFLAAGIRISTYGWTMARYFVVVVGIYAALSLTLMRIGKRDTAIPTVGLAIVLAIVGFYSPLSGYAVTLHSQEARLEAMLVENSLLDERGELVARPDLPLEVQKDISNQILFLLDRYEVDQIHALPSDFSIKTGAQFLGFEVSRYPLRPDAPYERYFNEDRLSPHLNVSEFDDVFKVYQYGWKGAIKLNSGVTVNKDQASEVLTFSRGDAVVYELDLRQAAADFYSDQSSPMVYTEDGVSIEVIFISFGGTLREDGSLDVEDYEAWVLTEFE